VSIARGDTKEQWLATNGGVENMFCKYGDKGENVIALQRQLLQLDSSCLPEFGADGGYGNEVAAALSRLIYAGTADGKTYQGEAWALMQSKCAEMAAKRVGGGGGLVPHTHEISGLSVSVTGSGSTQPSTTGGAIAK